MNGRLAGIGPILMGAFLLYSGLPESGLFHKGPEGDYHTSIAGLGAFLFILGLVFLIKNLK